MSDASKVPRQQSMVSQFIESLTHKTLHNYLFNNICDLFIEFFFHISSVAHFGPKTALRMKVDNCVESVKSANDPEDFHLFIFSNTVLIVFAALYISWKFSASLLCSATSLTWSTADSLHILSGSLARGDFLNEMSGTFPSINCYKYFL